MSDSRKEFEMEMAAKFSDFKPHELEQDDYGRYASDRMAHRYEGWQLALSVAPAPVAGMITLRIDDVRVIAEATHESDWFARASTAEVQARDRINYALHHAQPVQEGPKGVEAEAKFDELVSALCKSIWTDAEGGSLVESNASLDLVYALLPFVRLQYSPFSRTWPSVRLSISTPLRRQRRPITSTFQM